MIKVPHWLPVGPQIPWLEELGDPRFRVPESYAPKMKIPEAEKTPEQKSAEEAQRVLEEMGRVNPRAPRPEMIPLARSDYLQQFLEEGAEQKPSTREIQLRRVQEQTIREFNLRFLHMDGVRR